MKWFCLLSVVVLTSQAMQGEQETSVTLPPVLRKSEPSDNVVVTLPGPARVTPAVPANLLPETEVRLAPPPPDPDRPIFRRTKRDYPAGFERDSAEFLSRQIGVWQQMEAQGLLGEPVRQRAALSDDQTVDGQILAFADPTGRYKELELDFDRDTGLLRTVFVYPLSMTWQDCRHAFGANARPTQTNKGRTFYSYLDRRLDVLVDSGGKVISLGLY